MKAGTGPNARRQRARKRAADREFVIARQQRYVQARGFCERCKQGLGGEHLMHAHHVKRRSQGVDHSVENLRAFCALCHDWVHHHVAESKEQGWLA